MRCLAEHLESKLKVGGHQLSIIFPIDKAALAPFDKQHKIPRPILGYKILKP